MRRAGAGLAARLKKEKSMKTTFLGLKHRQIEPPLYDSVVELSNDIMNAIDNEESEAELEYYQELEQLCEEAESSALNHPFQWEVLADLTPNNANAIKLYKKGVAYAHDQALPDFIASIKLSLARRYLSVSNNKLAYNTALEALEAARDSSNNELKQEINDFLLRK